MNNTSALKAKEKSITLSKKSATKTGKDEH
jgi:hypothetical protein